MIGIIYLGAKDEVHSEYLMCGIAGYWGDFPTELLEEMNLAQFHRGPDGGGTYRDPDRSVGLAHRRLAIIDLSPSGHQPMWDAQRRVCIVYNGELYNYRELRAQLLSKGHSFVSDSDTEVLIAAYLEWGKAMFSHLNGIYALALWDPREDELLLARDDFGVKPLYYAKTKQGVLFASELKAIAQCSTLDRTIDEKAVLYHLTYLWSPAPHTMFRNVRKLEPGSALLIQNGRVTKSWRHHAPPLASPSSFLEDEESAIAAVGRGLETAVSRQLVADVPVGAFLSGGLDSSALVAMFRKLEPDRPIQCFTIDGGTEKGFSDDLPYAQRVAAHLNVDLNIVRATPSMTKRLPELLYHLDEPQADPAPINALLIAELARSKGIKVLLSGAGGDDVFSGYRRHHALQLERAWGWLPHSARKALTATARQLPTKNARLRRIQKAFLYAAEDPLERIVSYFYWLPPQEAQNLLGPRLQEHLGHHLPSAPLIKSLRDLPADTPPLEKMLHLERQHFLADHNLNYTDKSAMAMAVEVRVPMLDRDLVDLAVRIPTGFKQRGSEGKWILKKAMEPFLPSDVIYRPKTGFGAPLRRWLDEDWSSLRDELLSARSITHRGLFSVAGVARLLDLDRSGRLDASYPIFSLMCIEIWCRIFVDVPKPSFAHINL